MDPTTAMVEPSGDQEGSDAKRSSGDCQVTTPPPIGTVAITRILGASGSVSDPSGIFRSSSWTYAIVSPPGETAGSVSFVASSVIWRSAEPSGCTAYRWKRPSTPSRENTISPFAASAGDSPTSRSLSPTKASRRATKPPAVPASTANASNPVCTRRTRSRCERRRASPSNNAVAVHRALGSAEPACQLVIDLRHRSSPRCHARRAPPRDAPSPARASSSRSLR